MVYYHFSDFFFLCKEKRKDYLEVPINMIMTLKCGFFSFWKRWATEILPILLSETICQIHIMIYFTSAQLYQYKNEILSTVTVFRFCFFFPKNWEFALIIVLQKMPLLQKSASTKDLIRRPFDRLSQNTNSNISY